MASEESRPRGRGRPPKPLDADGSSAARLGIEVRRYREQRGLTQAVLAGLMGYSPQHLSALELGEGSVSEQFVQACDDALEADGHLMELLPDVVYERAQARWSNRTARQLGPPSPPSSSAPSPASASGLTNSPHPPQGVASVDAEVIRAMIDALRRVDNRFGGGNARGVVLGYLKGEVYPVLRMVQTQGRVPRRLMQVAAELTQLAGWISHDVGEDGLARRYFGKSLKLARAAGDEAFACEVLAGISQQAAYLGDGRTAVDAAQAARRHAVRSDVPALVSEAAAMEAHGHALRRDAAACLAAMRRAELALGAARDDARPPWLEYFDGAYLAAKFAHAFHALGEGKPAERFAVRSLQMNEGYERGRLFNTVLLARIYADRGELEAACELGRSSVAMASGIRSARGRSYLADLRRRLEPHAAVPDVRTLRAEIHSLGAC
jgi:transcriptional regulator with XRE-family HTH domain